MAVNSKSSKKKAGIILSGADMKRRYPQSGLASDICLTPDNALWLPSRILPLNYNSGGGVPYGKILELYGEESTGKTLQAIDYGVVAQSLGGIVLWDDAEATFDGLWAQSHGLDLKKVVLLKEENVIEIVSDWIADNIVTWRAKLTKKEPIPLVVDSLAALETWANMEAADSDSGEDMGKRSKMIYQMMRKRMKIIAKYGVCVICINQIRKKVGATKWEDPDTTPGGQAMRFYAGQRIGLYKGSKIKNADKKTVGNIVYVRTKKNKVAPPRENIQARVFFTEHEGRYGYDKYFGLLDILLTQKIIKRKSGRFYYKGEQLAHGEDKFLTLLETNAELRSKLIKKAGINTPSATRKKLEEIKVNLYPVNLKKAKIQKEDEEEE